MKIGAGKIIGAAMFAAGVAAIWLWPKSKVDVAEETIVTIMCGLAFATLLTMIVVPVNYALLYGVKRQA